MYIQRTLYRKLEVVHIQLDLFPDRLNRLFSSKLTPVHKWATPHLGNWAHCSPSMATILQSHHPSELRPRCDLVTKVNGGMCLLFGARSHKTSLSLSLSLYFTSPPFFLPPTIFALQFSYELGTAYHIGYQCYSISLPNVTFYNHPQDKQPALD